MSSYQKTKKRINFIGSLTIRMPIELKEEIERAGVRTGRSSAGIMLVAVQDWLERWNDEQENKI